MKVEKYIIEYLQEGRLMQLATVSKRGSWVCTVYFVADEQCRLYWLSFPDRRHSRELARDPRVAAAIVVKPDQPVIGIQTEGVATAVTDGAIVQKVMQLYTAKYNMGHDFYDNFVAGANKHTMYCLAPKSIVLFDEVHFKSNPRQEWRLDHERD